MRIAALVLGLAVAVTIARPAAADTLSVADIGSFHVGGRAVSLTGLPTKDVVFTAGSAPVKVDPNGDFEVEQMYVQYVNGNGHMLMMDRNSDQVAQMIQKWMTDKGLMN